MSYQYDEGARESGPALQKFGDRVYLGPKTYTAAGAVRPSGIVMINSQGTKVAMTLEAPKSAGQLLVVTQIDAGSDGHTLTSASGTTLNGTNNTATFNAVGETLLLLARSATTWVILSNVGSVSMSSV